jgi:hypothetical protein
VKDKHRESMKRVEDVKTPHLKKQNPFYVLLSFGLRLLIVWESLTLMKQRTESAVTSEVSDQCTRLRVDGEP